MDAHTYIRMCTKQTTDNAVMFTLTTVGGRGTSISPTAVLTPPGNTDKSPPTPSGPCTEQANMQPDGKYSTL